MPQYYYNVIHYIGYTTSDRKIQFIKLVNGLESSTWLEDIMALID